MKEMFAALPHFCGQKWIIGVEGGIGVKGGGCGPCSNKGEGKGSGKGGGGVPRGGLDEVGGAKRGDGLPRG